MATNEVVLVGLDGASLPPRANQELIVLQYSDKSECNNLPSYAGVDEAKKAVDNECVSEKNGSTSNISTETLETTISAKAQSPTDFISNTEFEKVEKNDNSEHVEWGMEKHTAESVGSFRGSNSDLNSVTLRLVGNRLFVNGFEYLKTGSNINLDRTYWRCKEYSSRINCYATAITLNPSMNQRPVLLKGPVESKHKHKAVNSNLRDARKMVTCDYREDISKIESINRCLKKDVPAQIESSSVSQMKQAKLEEVRQSNGLERIRLVVDKETSEPVASKIDNATRSARLIGKRLCIDGYIYKTRSYASGKIYWDCQNMYSRLCKAKAITSNPIADNNKFVVYKGIESSKHNHPASFAQVERAEEVAKISRKICSRRRRFKPKLTNQTSKTPKRENGSLQPNCSRSSNATRVDGKMLRKSSRSAASNASERSLAARNYWKIRRKGLLKNDVMYRQFLVKFLERPIFDRKNVTEALQVIYTSPGGCSIAYATVLENREKIERDLQSLRSNSNAEITSLDSGSFNISQNAVVQSVVADIDTHKYTECDNSIAVEINDVTANQENAKPTVGESRQEVLGTCTTRLEVPTEGSRPQVSSPPRQESELNNTATSVPETQNATNLSSSVPIPTTTDQDDLQPKREAVVIDLTDDLDDIKVELKSSASGENSMQPNPIAQPASTWKTPVPFTPNFGLPREPNTFGLNPQNYYPFTMPPHYWYPVNNCSPEYNPLLNWTMQNSTGYNFNMENPNVPYLNAQNPYIPNVNAQNFNGSVNIAQAQWFSNVSNMKNGVAVNGEQFHAQTEPHQRPY